MTSQALKLVGAHVFSNPNSRSASFVTLTPFFSDEKLGSKEMEIRTLVGEALSLPAYSSLTHMG